MSRTILIVDDEPDFAGFLSEVLSGEDFDVKISNSAKHALELIRENQFSSIFLDIVMPDMDGIELLRELDRIKSLPPIVLMSGYDRLYLKMAETIIQNSHIKLVGIINKPVRFDDLIEVIRNLEFGDGIN